MKNHLSFRLYPSMGYVVNVVSDVNLQSHINFNATYRPSCLLYIDGKRELSGCIKQDCLNDYDDFAKATLDRLQIDLSRETTPFQ